MVTWTTEKEAKRASWIIARVAAAAYDLPAMIIYQYTKPQRIAEARQLAHYVLVVVSDCSPELAGRAYRRTAQTIKQSMARVEDRRDDARYDDFVTLVEWQVRNSGNIDWARLAASSRYKTTAAGV